MSNPFNIHPDLRKIIWPTICGAVMFLAFLVTASLGSDLMESSTKVSNIDISLYLYRAGRFLIWIGLSGAVLAFTSIWRNV